MRSPTPTLNGLDYAGHEGHTDPDAEDDGEDDDEGADSVAAVERGGSSSSSRAGLRTQAVGFSEEVDDKSVPLIRSRSAYN